MLPMMADDGTANIAGSFGPPGEAATAIEQFLDEPTEPIVFRGDGDLFKPPQLRQRVFLLAVNVLSILDVIRGENHFKRANFLYDANCGRPIAEIAFGYYVFEPTHCGERSARQPASISQLISEFKSSGPAPSASSPPQDGTLYKLKTSTPQVALNILRESQSQGRYSANNLYSGDVTWRGHLPVPMWVDSLFDVFETYTSVGYAFYGAGAIHGNGPYASVSLGIPETELTLGTYARWFNYPKDNRWTRLPTAGVQFSAGFSYLTLLVEGGYAYNVQSNGSLVRGRMWGGGMRFSAPVTRLTSPHLPVEKVIKNAMTTAP